MRRQRVRRRPRRVVADGNEIGAHNEFMVVGTEMPRNLTGMRQLAKVVFLKADRECFHRLRHTLTHQAYYGAGVYAAAQKSTQRYFAH